MDSLEFQILEDGYVVIVEGDDEVTVAIELLREIVQIWDGRYKRGIVVPPQGKIEESE